MNLVDYCIKLPNLGLFLFYIIFIIVIPIILFIHTFKSKNIKNILQLLDCNNCAVLISYFSILIGLSNTFTLTWEPYIFNNLYKLNPNGILSWISTNFINLLVLVTIIFQSVLLSKSNVNLGNISLSIISMIICRIYLMINGIKYIVESSDRMIKKENKNIRFKLHRLIAGILSIIIIFILDKLFLEGFSELQNMRIFKK